METRPGAQFRLTVANFSLLIFLLLLIFIVMLFPFSVQKALYQICISGILISAFLCLDKKYRMYMRWLVAGGLVLQWLYFSTGNFVLNGISKTIIVGLYIIIVMLLVRQAASSKTVTRIVILESVNGYLMIGLFYSILVALIMLLDPGAYHFQTHIQNTEEISTNFNEYLYYGFNAFTTVTYGDVMPLSPVAKSVSMAMGLTGQMYVAIIIAMLVGKFVGGNKKSEP